MGAAMYVIVEGADQNTLPALGEVCGKAAARRLADLDAMAAAQALPAISTFVSMSADDVEDLLGDDADIDLPETAWWPAAEPLPTVVALESACTKEVWKERDAVVADLKSFRRVLESAVALDLRVRFAFDV